MSPQESVVPTVGPAATLAIEALLVGCVLAATFWMQGRKRSYL
jgi:hypothetical protein